MRSLKLFTISVSILVLISCGDSTRKEKTLNLVSSDSPIDLLDVGANYYKDISYGKSERNSFDLFIPDSEEKTPLVIFVHGGGFVGGNKEKAYRGEYQEHIKTFLKNKFAFATINYRFISDPDSKGVITSLNDAKRSLQFIKYHSEEFNINRDKIGMYGSSAGSGISLWLGLHDDMKQSTSDDPLEKESSRLKAVGALETQATYDIIKWGTIVFEPFNISFEKLSRSGMNKTLLSFYNINNLDELYSEKMIKYRKDIDFLSLMSEDDPPIWVKNSKYDAEIPQSRRDLNHHPFHAKVLKEQADKIGMESQFYIPKLGIEDSTGLDLVEFMIKNLK